MKRPYFIGFIFLSIFISCTTTSRFSQKYPYGLLTDDYGILNEDDLGVYAWLTTEPVPFSERKSNLAYMYWQCFPTSVVKLGCRKIENDDDPKNPYSDADIRIENETEVHTYEFRRGIELDACYSYLKSWKKLIAGEVAVCFGGNPGNTETKVIKGKIKKVTGWVYDKLKTKKGCYAYFGGEEGYCDIEYWRKEGYPY